jgi:Rieske Fe-S protein
MDQTGISRRGALTGASLGLTLPVLAACSGDEEPRRATDPGSSDPPATSEGTDTPTREAEPTEDPTKVAKGIVGTADVPVGGGLVLAKEKLVITQPTAGDFRGFTATCTHQGCTVGQVTDTIDCPCHGSMFSVEDGSVVGGPAPAPLAAIPLRVVGDQIDLA